MSDTAAPAVSQEAKPKQAKRIICQADFPFRPDSIPAHYSNRFHSRHRRVFVMRATGDPISAALGGRLTPDELQKRVHAAGYDRPLIVQYIDYLGVCSMGISALR